MSRTFTINDLNRAYQTLKNAYLPHALDTHLPTKTIVMNENDNTPAQTFLSTKLELAKEIDKAQSASRAALKLACESGSADIVMQMAIAIQTIDKAWQINQEQVKEFSTVVIQNESIQLTVEQSIALNRREKEAQYYAETLKYKTTQNTIYPPEAG
jgi:hypothetical protein